jgi:uncharacterized protein (DUF983 family)
MALPNAVAHTPPFSSVRVLAAFFEERDVQAMWNARVTGSDVPCSRCGKGRVGLSITDLRWYRWRCMACGSESAWFFVDEGAARFHVHPQVWTDAAAFGRGA